MNTRNEFCEWLPTKDHEEKRIILAHNLQGYDSYFMLQIPPRKRGKVYHHDAWCESSYVIGANIQYQIFDSLSYDTLLYL